MVRNGIIILTGFFLFFIVGCGDNDEKTSEEKGKKFAENLLEGIIEHAAKEDGKDIDVNIDFDNTSEDGVMTIKGEDGEEVKIAGEDGKLTITGENGEEVVFSDNEKEIPKSIPDDVYIADGEVESSGTVKSGEGEIITFSIKSKDNFSDVISKISKKMKSNGWKSNMNMNMGGESIQMFTKGDNSATITSKKKDNYAEVAYMVTVKIK